MKKSVEYVNGVIAAKEVNLLGDKISRLCEGSAEDAFRAITESGFCKNAAISSVYDYEQLLYADERDLDTFIREYAPSDGELAYLLSPRDFHNAKAIFKAAALNCAVEYMLAPEGNFDIETLKKHIEEKNFKPLGTELSNALTAAFSLLENDGSVSGAETGAIFERALYRHLNESCKHKFTLKKLIAKKADMTDILTALRSKTPEYAAKNYVLGGKLKEEQLNKLFSENEDERRRALDGTDYAEFLKLCLDDRESGLPLTRGELICDNAEIDFLSERKYELKRAEPFLYYVLRRRAENANLRILFACLIAGMDEGAIKQRLRAV